MSLRLSRRHFLKGLGATGLALPLMPSLSVAQQNGQFPKRFVFFYSANGTVPNRWAPTGTENNWALSEILQPLAPFKEKLLVLEGVDMRVTSTGPGSAHQRGMGSLLTGMPLNDGTFGGGGNTLSGWASGISIDQHIANERNDGTPFHSLQLGVRSTGGENRQTCVYAGSDQPIMPDNDPYNVFGRLFQDIDQDPFGMAQLRAQRQSVLDYVMGDLDRLKTRLSAADRIRLDAHNESIRRIEQRLASAEDVVICESPNLGQPIDVLANDNMPTIGQLQMDLAVAALACDLTRVCTIQFSRATSGMRPSWLGLTDGHHDLSHEGDSNATAQDRLVAINTWYAEQFAYLLGKMDAIPEGDGTMLDNSIVFWGNSLGKGNSHTRNDIPVVLAGSAGGYFKTGRFLTYGDNPHNDLLVSIANAMGVSAQSFGDPDFCNGELPRLRG